MNYKLVRVDVNGLLTSTKGWQEAGCSLPAPTAWQTLDRALTLILKIKSTWRVFKLLNIKHFSDIFINALFEDYKSFQKDDFLI